MRRPRPRDQRGAAAVEFALVVPILLMIIWGMITTGLVYSDHLAATNAVREGARYGAAADASLGTWASSVKTRVEQTYFNDAGADPDPNEICVKLVKSDKSTYASDLGGSCGTAPDLTSFAMDPGTCAVVVWMQRPASIELIIAPDLPLTIGAESIAYYGREVGTTCTAP